MGRYSNCALPSVGSPLATLHSCASAISVAVQALQNAKLKICEQVPVFNLRLLHLWCATATVLGLIAVLHLSYFGNKMGRYSNCALPSVGSPLATLPRCASAVSVAVQALQNAKLKICEQVPVFNLRLLHLWCATATVLGLIAVLHLSYFGNKMGRYSNCALPSVGSPLATLPRCASAVSVAVQALQNAKLKICEQVPVFNCRLLHLRCVTAVALGLIAALTLLRSLFPATPLQYQSQCKHFKMRN